MTLCEQRRFRKRLLISIRRRSGTPASNPIGANLLGREISRYLNSGAVQSATLEEIWREKLGDDEALLLWRDAQQRPLVGRDYRRFRGGTVEWHHKPRRTSGFRKLCSFSAVEKMWHRLASDLIVAQHNPRPHIGDWRGRGRDSQMRQITEVVRSDELFVVCADVRRAFPSVCTDALYGLPFLPEQLVRRAIDSRTHQFVRRERGVYARHISQALPDDLEVPPSGLMEGSPASNAIFAYLLDDLPDHLGNHITVFCYCDNVILFAPNFAQAQQAKNALVEYFTSHRAGPFEVVATIQSVHEPFEHLGYSLQWNDGLQIALSLTNWYKMMEKLENSSFVDAMRWLQTSFSFCSKEEVWRYVYLGMQEHFFREFAVN